MSNELWKSVAGREGCYEVSSLGRVRSLPSGHGRGKAGCMLRQGTNSAGYKGVVLAKGGKKEWRSTHRLVAQAFIENPLAYPFVNHIDSDKLNNAVSNLEWCTAKSNSQHASSMGRIRSGRNHPKSVSIELFMDGVSVGVFDTLMRAAKYVGAPYPSFVVARFKNVPYRGYVIKELRP